MLIFKQGTAQKCAYAPQFGKTEVKYVKNWSICAIFRQKRHENAQKTNLCSFLSRERRKNAYTLHDLEKSL